MQLSDSDATIPSAERLSEAFSLDRESGRLFWINPGKNHKEKIGLEAGFMGKTRWIMMIDGKKCARGQIVLCMVTGVWPGSHVRHINGDNFDDRPENLEVSEFRVSSIGDEAIESRYARNIGMRFGELTFNRISECRGDGGRIKGVFDCSCGKSIKFPIGRVISGGKKHCGCMANRATNLKHGMRNTPEYSSWQAMKARCLDPGNKDYARWGGRGITIFPEWIESFESFYAYIGDRPPKTSIDRIDNERGYFPGNVRWATSTQQARNTNVFTIISTPNGDMPLVDYADLIGISRGAAHMRMKRGKLEGCSYATTK